MREKQVEVHSFFLTPLSRCLSPVWSSLHLVSSSLLCSPCYPWAGGRSSAARCGGFLPTRSTCLMWCLQAVTWRSEASPMPRMSHGDWPWTPPSERAGRGNSQWQWTLGQCREQKTLRSSPLNAPACLFWHRPFADWSGSWKEPLGQHRWTECLRCRKKNKSHVREHLITSVQSGNIKYRYNPIQIDKLIRLPCCNYLLKGRWPGVPPQSLWVPPAVGCQHSRVLLGHLHPLVSLWG